MDKKDANQLNTLSLAFLGDAEYTLFVRKRLVEHHDHKSGALHEITSKYVCAKAQAKCFDALDEFFTDEEKEIGRRCRNTHNPTKAKNATLADYKKATALEGVIGYLSLTNHERMMAVMEKSVEIIEKEKENE